MTESLPDSATLTPQLNPLLATSTLDDPCSRCKVAVCWLTSAPPQSFRYLACNPTYAQRFGAVLDQVIGRSPADVLPQEQAQVLLGHLQQCVATGKDVTFDEAMPQATTEASAWWQTTLSPLSSSDGGIDQILCTSVDITERKQLELALQQSEARLIATARSLPGVISCVRVRADGGWDVPYLEGGGAVPWGIDLGAIATHPHTLWQWVYPDDRQLLQEAIANPITEPLEWRITSPSGQIHWLQASGQWTQQDNGDRLWHGVILDVTQRKHIEQTLHNLIASTAAASGEALFQVLVHHLAKALQVDRVIVTRSQGANLVTLAVWADGAYLPNFSYDPKNTPCDLVLQEGAYYQARGIQESFPDDSDLVAIQAEGYYGIRLDSSNSDILGHLCLVHTQSMAPPSSYEGVLQLFASRIVAELERQQAEMALRNREALYRLLAENMTDLVCRHTLEGQYLYVSPSCLTMLGYSSDELLSHNLYDLVHPEDVDRLRASFNTEILHDQTVTLVYRIRHHANHYLWLETTAAVVPDANAHPTQIQSTSRVIDERIQTEEKLRFQALHDDLTGLPNRNLLTQRLELALKRFQHNPREQFAVLFLDLDRFKVINDSLGHLAGDALLIHVAQKLQSLVREVDVAARLGGDEFVILLEGVDIVQTAFNVASRIIEVLQVPFWLGDRSICINVSIGIVMGSASHHNAADLLRDADLAMYRAKASGGNCYEVFEPMMHLHAVERLNLENDFRDALGHGHLTLYYQAIVNLATGAIAGFEALARWQHPQRGIILPDEFLPMAEETGLIEPFGRWVFEQACAQMAEWKRTYASAQPLTLNLNLTARQFRQPHFVHQSQHILTQTGLSGADLILELREPMLVSDLTPIITRLDEIRALGIQLSIDEFGTGLCSLNHLHQFPLNFLKIPQAFVQSLPPTSSHETPILGIIMALAQQLNLQVVASGIETPIQVQQMRQLGCHFGQGYYWMHPLSANKVTTLLQGSLDVSLPQLPCPMVSNRGTLE